MIKTIKNLLAILFITCFTCSNVPAIGMPSTSDVKAAIDQTIAHLEQAVAAHDKGDSVKAVELLMEAKQVQKSISSSNGQLSMIKARATHQLGLARTHFNDGDSTGGAAAMKEALAGFKDLKEKYNAEH